MFATTEVFNWLTANVWAVLNSNFTAALAGAFAGALAAQRVAERAKRKEHLESQIIGINAAIGYLVGIVNHLVNVKKQHVMTTLANYLQLRNEAVAFNASLASRNSGPRVFHALGDFRSFSLPSFPIEELRTLSSERISLSHRGILLVMNLMDCIQVLGEQVRLRNELNEEFRLSTEEDDIKIPRYFGIGVGSIVDQRYPDCVNGICLKTDAALQFSEFLMEDLVQQGKRLRDRFHQEFGEAKMGIISFDFPLLAKQGLMPNRSEFKDWEADAGNPSMSP